MFCLSTFRFLIVKNSGDHVSKSSEKVCTQDDSLGSMNRNVGIDNNVLFISCMWVQMNSWKNVLPANDLSDDSISRAQRSSKFCLCIQRGSSHQLKFSDANLSEIMSSEDLRYRGSNL